MKICQYYKRLPTLGFMATAIIAQHVPGKSANENVTETSTHLTFLVCSNLIFQIAQKDTSIFLNLRTYSLRT